MNYEIVPIDKLLPLELVFPGHLKNLEEMIDKDGFILKAIIVDKKTGTILDGSHRYVYLLKKGYMEVPVYYTDYDNEDVRVGTHLCHRYYIDGTTGISKRECRQRAVSGNLFYPRTTRHFFTFRKSDISLSLDQLAKGDPVNVDHLIANVNIKDEIINNEKYIREIDDEVELMIKYLSEVYETKKYLSSQVKRMKETGPIAFFPGKFHPPHLGHLKTILDLSKKYSKVIIGVSEHTPGDAVTNVESIIHILNSMFEHNSTLEVVRIKGILVEKPNTDGLPHFDILLSGNQAVLSWARELGIHSQYISRAEGNLFSGTMIRDALNEG